MPTPRETILAALQARLSALSATALRGEVLPERVPADGLMILRDGEPGKPEATLSPLAYHYQHRVEIEVVVQGAGRDAVFDSLCASCVAAVEKSLKTIPGVKTASVNLATESATVSYDDGSVAVDDLSEAVDRAGYKVVSESEAAGRDMDAELEKDEKKIHDARRRMWTAWGITIPIMEPNTTTATMEMAIIDAISKPPR